MGDSKYHKGGKRAKNFSEKECCILLDLVKKNQKIIESRKTDGVSLKVKELIWKEIAEEYNKRIDVIRDWSTLKVKYENIKKVYKRKFANQHPNASTTGESFLQASAHITPDDWAPNEITGSTADGEQSNCDSDSAVTSNNEEFAQDTPWVQGENETTKQLSETIKIELPDVEAIPECLVSCNLSEALPQQQTPDVSLRDSRFREIIESKSSPLQVERPVPLIRGHIKKVRRQKVSNFSMKKLQLLEIQKKIHEKHLHHMDEEHRLKMRNLELQNQILELDLRMKVKQL